jgi:phosphatidylinositol alpha-1,6-mannosyltransferase
MDNRYLRPSSALFLTLAVFKSTGGIQKVCRTFCKVLMDIGEDPFSKPNMTLSLHDSNDKIDQRYANKNRFRGFNNDKTSFFIETLRLAITHEIIILSHINLLSIAVILKLLYPKKRFILFAHGIEVWKSFSSLKRYFLRKGIEIWCVSEYTRDEVKRIHKVHADHLKVLNNCLDPFFRIPGSFNKDESLLNKHGLALDQPVMLTITRMSNHEKLKGYFSVFSIIPNLLTEFPNLHYFLAGKADTQEKESIVRVIKQLKIEPFVTLLDFIEEAEMTAYYKLSDVFVMPSSKEGFGLVFLEAAACGCRIIAGNKDGSRDAVLNGILVDPYNHLEIEKAIKQSLRSQKNNIESLNIQQACLKRFSYEVYKNKVQKALDGFE